MASTELSRKISTLKWLSEQLRKDCTLDIVSNEHDHIIQVKASETPEVLHEMEFLEMKSNTGEPLGETASATIVLNATTYELQGKLGTSPDVFKPIAYNSGGGIWVCEMDLGDGTYAVIDSESIICNVECLSIYNYAEEPFMPEDMFFSENVEDLDHLHKALYMHMKSALIAEMNRYGYSL